MRNPANKQINNHKKNSSFEEVIKLSDLHYRKVLDFVETVILGMNIDTDNSSVGLLGFGTNPFIEFNLKDHSEYHMQNTT